MSSGGTSRIVGLAVSKPCSRIAIPCVSRLLHTGLRQAPPVGLCFSAGLSFELESTFRRLQTAIERRGLTG